MLPLLCNLLICLLATTCAVKSLAQTFRARDFASQGINSTASDAQLPSSVTQNATEVFVTEVDPGYSDPLLSQLLDDPIVTGVHANDSGRGLLQDHNILSSGNYLISNCNSSNAAVLLDTLPKVWSDLQIVIAETRKGVKSAYGFKAFFKTSKSIPAVLKRYQNIANGTEIRRAYFPSAQPIPPTFICAQDDNPHPNILNQCKSMSGAALVYYRGTQFVVVCPLFFRLWPVAERWLCPELSSTGGVTPNNKLLASDQRSTLIHEMAHVYEKAHLEEEEYNINDVIQLSAEDSLKNAANFAFFYSAVIGGCTSWPTTVGPRMGADGGL